MAFFQNSVLNKHLKGQDDELIKTAYQKFTSYFHNPAIQQNIRDAKEEQFQEGFLRELFVNILGYTLNPQPDYNLTTELKNEKGAKKADGAILKDGQALGVIELKGTDTKDLDKINEQAFNYKNNQTGCVYVVTANFEKLRFFVHNAVEHIEFNLFTLSLDEFKVLWLCLNADNLLGGVPLKVKEESLLVEENITKQLYKDYSAFKTDIWRNMAKNHPQDDPLMLFKKTQKLLDRFLFIFFAEDSGLLPPNSITKIIDKWKQDTDWGEDKKLFDIYKQYFGFINKGRPARGDRAEIFGYNGGLFQDDLILDNINIDDEILLKHTEKLTAYDFQSEVDVNILGHIFENSLNEIESITAELKGLEVDKSKSKRKRDGVFYTPKYITKYIVDNTVGKLCEEKKAELNITDERFGQSGKRSKKGIADLKAYKDWLLGLKICDPACGSGAFLNQALEFLIDEHQYLDELTAQYHKSPLVLSDIETQILEQNIYGVDINEESVEIARLSLWLRTAQKGRKLTTLNHNIKCGNSLIDDPAVAGEKAFNWQKEFPDVFQKKEKKAWHVTTATHNSRYSQRMFDNYVKTGEPVWLSEKEEILVTETIAEIVEKDKLNVIAYNICGDHMHMLLVCTEEELQKIVQKIKSMSARACNIAMGRTVPATTTGATEHAPSPQAPPDRESIPSTPEHAPGTEQPATGAKEGSTRGETQFHLWTQKFGKNEITSSEQLENTIRYIQNNRNKHQLPENQGLQEIIDKMCCTRQHAFQTEYKGGFDVVIGNPPYVRAELLGDFREYFNQNYQVFHSASDLFAYFYELGSNLIKPKEGLMGYISNTFDKTTAGKVLRDYLTQEITFHDYIDFTEVQVFEGATTYPVIIILDKSHPTKNQFKYVKVPKEKKSKVIEIETLPSIEVLQETLSPVAWSFLSKRKAVLFNKLTVLPTIREKFGKCYYGVKTALNDAFIVQNDWMVSKHVKYIYEGKEIKKWHTPAPEQKLILFESKWTKAHYGDNLAEEQLKEKLSGEFPEIIKHLLPFEEKAKKRYDKGEFWWELRNCAYYDLFNKSKIIFPNLQNTNKFCLDSLSVFVNAPAVFLPVASKTLLCILNSKIVWEFLKSICVVRSGGYIEVKPQYFEQIPVPDFKNESEFEKKADSIINLTSEMQKTEAVFINLLQTKFEIEKQSKKLQNWPELDFKDFLKELKKAKVQLSLSEEGEWMQYFNEQKEKAQGLKLEINRFDKEIDQMVYVLYGLTEEEIAIVEGS